ncbi:hypothetical protein EFBL_2691 [Effusibacillus lacus]|uniref:Uncharacterized protein n=1 Tax=Effusibacillus lacus TaxID=1348429 RepID=A0A292YQ51_9BACL|nr:hypothetical protein EFBL_2691 [Effusibacillus lacus]
MVRKQKTSIGLKNSSISRGKTDSKGISLKISLINGSCYQAVQQNKIPSVREGTDAQEVLLRPNGADPSGPLRVTPPHLP